MAGVVLLRKGSLLQITSVIYSAVWAVYLILVLGPCSMITRSKREVRREGMLREDMHESSPNLPKIVSCLRAQRSEISVIEWLHRRL